MKKQKPVNEDEKDIIEAYARGEFKPAKAQKKLKSAAATAARRYVRKDARINIRLSTTDLTMIKRRAIEEGLPYQSLIASILHKYVSGYDPKHFER